ncbi:hypothetical protein BC827DRAFT_1199496 [Russula dissimulans]|nr:hypothetical protein BC827DRAFT_1199496 [Russula dissimulans]
MRTPSSILALLLIAGYFLPSVSASPVALTDVLLRKRFCNFLESCKFAEAPTVVDAFTLPSSTTAPSPSASTLAEPEVGAIHGSGSGSASEPSAEPTTKPDLRKANAGVALASHRTGLGFCAVFGGLVATVLVF